MKYLLPAAFLVLFFSCKEKSRPSVSFYYWRTSFALSGTERNALQQNKVTTLFTRYFDVDKEPGAPLAKPIAVIKVNGEPKNYSIVPVIYIKKRVFENTDSNDLAALAKNIHSLVSQVNTAGGMHTTEIQFDCDWTEQTRDAYFSFIRIYRNISSQTISATIRLHQVKYRLRTGIPPADRGVLMYYNMGEINPTGKNSVYDKDIAAKYDPSLSVYPLPLDVALPVFAWGQQVREGRVIGLLNKMDSHDFTGDSNFVVMNGNRLQVKHGCFKSGYYFKEKDEVKLESVATDELLDMAAVINKYIKGTPRTIIFYDLDSINIARYEKDIYKKVVDLFK